MRIKQLKKVIYIEDDMNTRINGELMPLSLYKNDEEIIKSIRVQDNGVVIIKTKEGNTK